MIHVYTDPLAQFEPFVSIVLAVAGIILLFVSFNYLNPLQRGLEIAGAIILFGMIMYLLGPQNVWAFRLAISTVILAGALVTRGGRTLVQITKQARDDADKDRIPNYEILRACRVIEGMFEEGGAVDSFMLEDTNIVPQFTYLDKGIQMVHCKRDQRYSDNGVALDREQTPATITIKGKSHLENQARKQRDSARKQKQREQAAAALLKKNAQRQQNLNQQGKTGRPKK